MADELPLSSQGSMVSMASMASPQSSAVSRKSTLNASSTMNREQLIIAVPVSIRGRRLRQILRHLPVDVMEVQMLAREFFARCDLQKKYMSLDKCAETFGISPKITKGVYSHIRTNDLLDDVQFNYARQLTELHINKRNYRTSVIEDLQEWSKIYSAKSQTQPIDSHRQSVLQLPRLYLTFENFIEASVYLSPRASVIQRSDLAFSIFDANGDGVVEPQEIETIMLDSLMLNLKSNQSANHKKTKKDKNEQNQKIQQIFKTEVESLISNLKNRYNSDKFNKRQFLQFAQSIEFLNCFTVNKHWLRDILGGNKDNARYARPQDAKMKNFLETMVEENDDIEIESIIEVQETLRDHLVDTLDDLRDLKDKHFKQMKIPRRLSALIKTKLTKTIIEEPPMNVQHTMDMNAMQLPDPSALALLNPNNQNTFQSCCNSMTHYIRNSWNNLCLLFPAIVVIKFSLIFAYLMVFALSFVRNNYSIQSSAANAIYYCIFLMPISRYYPFITKYFTMKPESKASLCLLYVTSNHFQTQNFYFFFAFVATHIIAIQMKHVLNNNDLVDYNLSSQSALIGWILLILIALTIFCKKKYMSLTKKPKILKILTRLFQIVCLLSLIAHAIISSHSGFLNIPLFISLFSSFVLLLIMMCEYTCWKSSLQVVMADNCRPNYVLLEMNNLGQNERLIKNWKCGQYFEIACPTVSGLEYHPFYITSAPGSESIKVSMLCCGDWTRSIWQIYIQQEHSNETTKTLSSHLPPLTIRGPFGIGFTDNKMNYNYDYLLLIASGTCGVEIIASMLHFACTNFLQNDNHPICKIYLYWIVSAEDACYWFYKLLKMYRSKYSERFFPCIFVTSSKPNQQKAAFGLNFFLALRRESMKQISENSQANGSGDFLSDPVSRLSANFLFIAEPNIQKFNPTQRVSRFNSKDISALQPLFKSENDKVNVVKNDKHGMAIELQTDDEDIPMTSPDFRNVFAKIREELLTCRTGIIQSTPNSVKKKKDIISQNSMHGIVPALVVVSSNARASQVGTFFVGSEVIQNRIKSLCHEFTDDNVVFHCITKVVGDNYSKQFS